MDFDCEARPLSWIGGDYVSKEITAIAAKWIGEPGDVQAWILGEVSYVEMLEGFRSLYDQADMVCGHNIVNYDLGTLNAMMMERHLPVLSAKLVHDTLRHLSKRGGAISGSQKNMSEMLGVEVPKIDMSDPKWRQANRLEGDGLGFTRERVTFDVLQNIGLREKLLERGYLNAPRTWHP